jgi:hypothetical protein
LGNLGLNFFTANTCPSSLEVTKFTDPDAPVPNNLPKGPYFLNNSDDFDVGKIRVFSLTLNFFKNRFKPGVSFFLVVVAEFVLVLR